MPVLLPLPTRRQAPPSATVQAVIPLTLALGVGSIVLVDGTMSFDQLLADWKVLSVTGMAEMFDNSGCPRSQQSCFYVVV
jgi:hypothetical protein